jgi:hypothetical protein
MMRSLIGPLVIIGFVVVVWMLFMSTPGDISDAKYAHFKQLAAPKVLYSCTRKPTQEALLRQTRECAASGRSGCEQSTQDAQGVQTVVEFAGGTGSTSYDELVQHARQNCQTDRDNLGSGSFKVLEAVK